MYLRIGDLGKRSCARQTNHSLTVNKQVNVTLDGARNPGHYQVTRTGTSGRYSRKTARIRSFYIRHNDEKGAFMQNSYIQKDNINWEDNMERMDG